MSARACQACEKPATDFQCPLCQAEGQSEQGFFCSQECFATNWLAHRNAFHKSGVVREKRGAAAPADAAAAKSRKTKKEAKRGREETESEDEYGGSAAEEGSSDAENSLPMYVPWPPMPSPASLGKRAQGPALVTPTLEVSSPRAVVAAAPGDSPLASMWPQIVAAAHHTAAVLAAPAGPGNGSASHPQILVVAGDVRVAHAFAWAARCAGLAGSLRMAVNSAQTEEAIMASTKDGAAARPGQLFSAQKPIVVATSRVVRAVGGAGDNGGSGAAALWLDDAPRSLLITLPDVVDAGDLQGVRTRAVFFISRAGTPAAKVSPKKGKRSAAAAAHDDTLEESGAAGAAAAWAAEEAITHTTMSSTELEACLPQSSPFPRYGMTFFWQPMPSLDNILEDDDDSDDDESESESDKDSVASGEAEKPAADHAPVAGDDEQLYTVSRQQCISDKLDNDLATCLANGDDAGALQHLIRVYSSDPGYFEEVFFNAVCCDWGALSVAHAHHRLARLVRRLVDASGRFAAKKGATLAAAALRAATRLVRLLPPMMADDDAADDNHNHNKDEEQNQKGSSTPASKKAKTEATTTTTPQAAHQPTEKERQDFFNYCNATLPNLQLQAILIYLFDTAPSATLDAFAVAWGVSFYLEGLKALQAANTARKAMVERIESRYTAKLDKGYASYLVVLAHLLYDAVATYSLTVPQVEARLLWTLTLAAEAGPLSGFLNNCFLLHDSAEAAGAAGGKTGAKVTALSGRQRGGATSDKESKLAALRQHAVRAAKPSDYIRLPWKAFPLAGQRERRIARLQQAALEEILMAMPRVPRPMYIGDVGNLIGKWFPFNARFGGVLGVSLSDFLSKHPEEFQLVGRLVTRRKAGKSEQVRVRFDQDAHQAHGSDSDSDGEGGSRSRKARDRAMLTGSSKSSRKKAAEAREKELPARARKKRAVKAFNKERFNRNYKQVDPSARVPGYVKHGPRRITGRGKKPNKRVVKRG